MVGAELTKRSVRVEFAELQGKVGEVIGTSDWYEMGQDRINRFADATEDHQFIHVDPERAAATPFGQTIAHGFLSLSMLAAFVEKAMPKLPSTMTVNYGLDKVRFLAPVKSGKRIRGQFTLKEMVEKRPGQWQLTLGISVEIEGEDKPALIADWILLMFA